ncbi:MAG: type IV pilus assembly protein PilM [Verrucomicrobia bacterium]|nr:type IV pilus assembly protein PilM [Kiritimatiellia bacterium]MCP5487471.1 type IV pilus assembly protein PilM [Verrucomicrobiota bacterium]
MAKGQRILALDVGASTVKIAEFTSLKAGTIELTNFGVSSLGLDPAHEGDRLVHITATVKELMQECGIKPGPALISVSGQSVFSRFVKLPPVDKDKVYQIILYEAQQNVPFPINEVVWDYQLIGGAEGDIDVMLAAIKADIIVGLSDAVEQAGLITDLVDVAPMALYNCFRYSYPEVHACNLIVDIGARSTDLIFMEGSRVFIRSIPVAGNAITQQIMKEFELSFDDAEDMKKTHAFVALGGAYEDPKSEVAGKISKIARNVMTRMHAEIDRSIKFYRTQQSGSAPTRILLTGGSSIIPYTDTFLKEKLKADVEYLNPFVNIPVSNQIEGEEIGRHAHEMAQAVGLALRKTLTCPIEINLLPPRVVQDKLFKQKQPVLVAALFALVALVAVWAGYFWSLDRLSNRDLERHQQRVQALEQVERPMMALESDLSAVQAELDALALQVDHREQWLKMLTEVQAVLPRGLWIDSLEAVRVTEDDTATNPELKVGAIKALRVSGRGFLDEVPNPEPLYSFRNQLRESERFSDATEFTSLPSPEANSYLRQFTLSIVLEQPIIL